MPTQRITALSQINPTPREILQANRTYYVRKDGDDGNNGLGDNSVGAFLTIQHAIDICHTLDLNGFTVTIQVRTGTYAPVAVSSPFVGGLVYLQGDTVTPSNTLISGSADCIAVSNQSTLYVAGFKLMSSANSGLIASAQGIINIFWIMEYGPCGFVHLYSVTEGLINDVGPDYKISGGASSHYDAEDAGVIKFAVQNITLTGYFNFPAGFANSGRGGLIDAFGQTYIGSGTGPRYVVAGNSVIFTNGGGANYFPGNSAGTASTGGQYL